MWNGRRRERTSGGTDSTLWPRPDARKKSRVTGVMKAPSTVTGRCSVVARKALTMANETSESTRWMSPITLLPAATSPTR